MRPYDWGGVLVPGGKVVFAPYNADSVGVFDTTTGVFAAAADVSAAMPGGERIRWDRRLVQARTQS